MDRLKFIPVLAIAGGLFLTVAAHAQNPPMNCTPDGIVEVCALVDTNVAPATVAPPAPAVPHITYKNGLLTITADNIPLGEVLKEVSRKTGATVEIPPGTAMEPVFVNIGPGSVREVLVALLNGTEFNYVMLGSQNTADHLQKIVLTPTGRSTEVAESGAASSPLSSAFSPRGGQTAQAAPDSSGSKPLDLAALIQVKREQYIEMIERAKAARDGDQSSGSDSPAQAPASSSPPQPPPSGSQPQTSGPDPQAQP